MIPNNKRPIVCSIPCNEWRPTVWATITAVLNGVEKPDAIVVVTSSIPTPQEQWHIDSFKVLAEEVYHVTFSVKKVSPQDITSTFSLSAEALMADKNFDSYIWKLDSDVVPSVLCLAKFKEAVGFHTENAVPWCGVKWDCLPPAGHEDLPYPYKDHKVDFSPTKTYFPFYRYGSDIRKSPALPVAHFDAGNSFFHPSILPATIRMLTCCDPHVWTNSHDGALIQAYFELVYISKMPCLLIPSAEAYHLSHLRESKHWSPDDSKDPRAWCVQQLTKCGFACEGDV